MPRRAGALGALVGLGAALRVVGLDAKGYWQDEASTVALLRRDLGDLPAAIADGERVPGLYYLLAWPWARVFGEGEVGLRSLSVLLGVAAIPVAYLAARELVSPRAGVFAAALVAANPLLVWYSQEARSYVLLVLLGAAALYFFARALRDRRRSSLALWGLCSVLAIGAHYFAGFLFAAQAAWVLAKLGTRRDVLAAAAVPALAGLALIPLAVAQQGSRAGEDWIAEISPLTRIAELPGFFLVGFELPLALALAAAAAAAALAGIGLVLLARRASPAARRGAVIAGSVAIAGIAIPLALLPLGVDAFVYRNVIGALIPLAIVVAAGFAAERAGAAGILAGGALVVLSAGVVLFTASEPKYQREAWREASAALGEPRTHRAVVATPGGPGREPLQLVYLTRATEIGGGAVRLGEIDLLALPRRELGAIATASLPDVEQAPRPPAPGFRLIEQRREEHFLLYRYRAHGRRAVGYGQLRASSLGEDSSPLVLVEAPE